MKELEDRPLSSRVREKLDRTVQRLIAAQHPGLASGLVFPSNEGTPLANSRISDALQDACKEAGIKQRVTSHGFRRTLTDLLRNATSEAVETGERVVRLLQPQTESTQESKAPETKKARQAQSRNEPKSLAIL